MFRVKKEHLLLIAGAVWLMAGFNVARLGMISYGNVEGAWYLYFLSLVIFALFGRMFFNMTEKHTERVLAYEETMPFWYFFDKKSYIIMFFMMSMGISLRATGLLPEGFIAFFYTGLGCALALSGILFLRNFFLFGKENGAL